MNQTVQNMLARFGSGKKKKGVWKEIKGSTYALTLKRNTATNQVREYQYGVLTRNSVHPDELKELSK